jgi:hypothetical protein
LHHVLRVQGRREILSHALSTSMETYPMELKRLVQHLMALKCSTCNFLRSVPFCTCPRDSHSYSGCYSYAICCHERVCNDQNVWLTSYAFFKFFYWGMWP